MTKVSAAAFDDQRLQSLISNRSRIIECESQAECRVRMHTRANWIILFRQKGEILFHQSIRERLEIMRPAPSIFIVPIVKFLGKFQQPRPAVRALE